MSKGEDLYRDRLMAEGYPEIESLYHERFERHLRDRSEPLSRVEKLLRMFERAVSFEPGRRVVVVGCGPRPVTIKALLEQEHHVTGVEPEPSYVESANAFLGEPDVVVVGAAERIPVPDASQDIAFFENVFEHVDSRQQSLSELYRVLKPGGLLYLTTTNRHHFSVLGRNDEFNVRFYNWLPSVVKESYVHRHLHFDPALANYTTRPAVHWFSFSDLCRLGRDAGFARFYSLFDLMRADDYPQKTLGAWSKRLALRLIQRSVLARSWALSQRGEAILMLKRPA